MKRCIVFLLALIMSMGIFTYGYAESEEQSGAEESGVKTVTSGGMEMDYLAFGSGEKSLIVLPGLSIHSVMGLADAIETSYSDFTDEYTVYVFDRAKNISEGYTVRDMARDTASAMQALGIESADVFGASQGGMIAMYIAIDHPELVHKMILCSTLASPNDTFLSTVNEWIALAQAKDETGLLESFADKVYSENTLSAYRDVLISSNAGITDEEYARFIILASACLTFDCAGELDKIQCPTLVIGAEGDKVLTSAGPRAIAAALGCESCIYDDSYGHAVYDEAGDIKERYLEFLHKEDA